MSQRYKPYRGRARWRQLPNSPTGWELLFEPTIDVPPGGMVNVEIPPPPSLGGADEFAIELEIAVPERVRPWWLTEFYTVLMILAIGLATLVILKTLFP